MALSENLRTLPTHYLVNMLKDATKGNKLKWHVQFCQEIKCSSVDGAIDPQWLREVSNA